MGYKRVFGLVMVWAHPCQACYHTLEEATHKLVLLADESMVWAYTVVWLNEALSHMSLSSEGHVSTVTGGMPSKDTHGWLHQLQICKLLQHKDMVVCSEGLNSKLEALQFTFQKLPLWDAAAPSEPACKPQLIEVDLSSMQPESMTTAFPVPTTTPVLPFSSWYCWASWWHHHGNQPTAPGGLGTAAADFPCSLSPCPSMQCAKERAAISNPRGFNWRNRGSPLGQKGQTLLSLLQWQPSCRCLCGQPHQVAPPASLMLLTHCSSQLCQRHQRWQ